MWTESDEQMLTRTFELIRLQINKYSRNCCSQFENISDKVRMSLTERFYVKLLKVFTYNVPDGKKFRVLMVVQAYRILIGDDTLCEEDVENSRIVGWCAEVLQASFIILDDIIDKSQTRRNRPCWYILEPECSIMHSQWLRSSVYYLLQLNCKSHNNYPKLVETFMDIEHRTLIGGTMDVKFCYVPSNANAFDEFTNLTYTEIATMKTAYYTTVLPVRLALLLANINDTEIHKIADHLLIRIGRLIQAYDDYVDVFGDEAVTGKSGTDIQDGKCTWIAVEAIAQMTSRQLETFKRNYGVNDEKAVQIIKCIYDELNMKSVFKTFEANEYKSIIEEIEVVSIKYPKLATVLLSMCRTYYKHDK